MGLSPTPLRDIPDAPLYATFALRVRALVLDGLILFGVLLATVAVAANVRMGESGRLTLFGGLIVLVIIYEPLLIASRGRTVGHWLCNLRVVAPTADGRLPLWKAFLRWFLKGLTGLASFATMGATPRNQALHDLAFGTTVQVADPTRAKPHDFILERPAVPAGTLPSGARRILVILGYLIVLLVLVSFGDLLAASPACLNANQCEPRERIFAQMVNAAWLAASIAACIFGWQGRLPGARRRPVGASPAADTRVR